MLNGRNAGAGQAAPGRVDGADIRLVNLEILAQYVGTNPVLQRKVSQKFLETARNTVLEMQRAAAIPDYTLLGSLAHRIKPSALAMGARVMGDLAAQLEQAAIEGCDETVHEHLNCLAPMLVQLEREIAALA